MENSSLNSSSSEPTASNLISIFKKPTDFYQAFEVSLEESVPAVLSNKSEPDLDNSVGTQKALPFKKSRKSVQQPFSVSLRDSVVNSECEESVTFVKRQSVFRKKQKSMVDFFNVSYNETSASSKTDLFSKSIDDSTAYSKTNPFNKNEFEKMTLSQNTSSIDVSQDENSESSLEPERHFQCDIDVDGADSTTFATKQNPFEIVDKRKNSSTHELQLSVTAENNSLDSEIGELKDKSSASECSRLNDKADLSPVKSNSDKFESEKSSQNCNSIMSVTEERSNKSPEKTVLTDPNEPAKNISLDRSISRVTNNTTSYLEQSSINDENMNNWMSDHSDEEMPPPRVPSITANLSQTKEKPGVSSSPAVTTNPLSVWEQKYTEIILNAERKSQAITSRTNSELPKKSKPFKKPSLNEERITDDFNKYKPPKLIKPAPFATRKLYKYIIKRLEPKYGIDKMIKAENLVSSICDTVKKVTRKRAHQKRLIQNLKKEMAEAGLIETTMDFYEFIIKFLPHSFRVKVVPCLQPVTNVVYPPKDVTNPFDKIL